MESDSDKPTSNPPVSSGVPSSSAGMSSSTAPPVPPPKQTFNEMLSEALEPFFRLQEKNAFIALAIWFVFVFVLPCWEFYQDIKEGEGFVMFVTFAALLFFLLVCFLIDLKHTKTRAGKVLFWKPWIAAILSPFVLICSSCWIHFSTDHFQTDAASMRETFNTQMDDTNYYWLNQIDFQNRNFAEITNHEEKLIGQFRRYAQGLPTKMSYAEMMGIEEITNIVSITNEMWITNLMTVAIQNFQSIRSDNSYFTQRRPILDFFQLEAISYKLKPVPHFPITIVAKYKDEGAIDLGKQIAQVFAFNGFDTKEFELPKDNPNNQIPLTGVTILCQKKPEGPLAGAIAELFRQLSQEQQWDYWPNAGTNFFDILVATTNQ